MALLRQGRHGESIGQPGMPVRGSPGDASLHCSHGRALAGPAGARGVTAKIAGAFVEKLPGSAPPGAALALEGARGRMWSPSRPPVGVVSER